MLPVQVQSTGYTDSKGTIIVSATCPQNYHVRSGSAQITPSSQNQGAYSIVSNGPNSERKAWVVSVENKAAGSLSITVTVTCTY